VVSVLVFWSVYLTGWAIAAVVITRRVLRRWHGEDLGYAVTVGSTIALAWPVALLWLV